MFNLLQAIVSAQIYIRQLVFESIHLGEKYKLKGLVPELLKPLDDVCIVYLVIYT